MANIFQNLIDNYTFPAAKVGRARSRAYQQVAREAAKAVAGLTTANTAQDEVTDIAQHVATVSGGTFTLSVNATVNAITYTTAGIAYNATAATIEAALDTASPATVGDGDINVAEAGSAGLSDGNCAFTCSGNLAEVPVLITIDGASLTGGGTAGAVTRTTAGQPDRNALQALFELNVIDGSVPDCGEASTDWTLPTAANDYIGWYRRARLELIWWLGAQLVVEEGITNNKLALLALYDLPVALFGPHKS